MSRPVIGLTTYAEETRFGVNDTFAAVLPLSYVHAVHVNGGRAVLVTPDDPDVDPGLYGEERHATVSVRPQRDKAELMLMRAALAKDLPLFGICRGMQLMTVAYGGKLHQHLPDVLGHNNHRPITGPKFGEHEVKLVPGSLCHRILGDVVVVNSFHHQGIADPGRLTPTGWCPDDGLIETVEDPSKRFVIGVQWHPEDTTDFRLFAALVEAARVVKSTTSIAAPPTSRGATGRQP